MRNPYDERRSSPGFFRLIASAQPSRAFDVPPDARAMARVLLNGLVMKTLSTIALLISLSSLAAGCMAPTGERTGDTGDESTQSTQSAMINNGTGPNVSKDDLLKQGWKCEPLDGHEMCTKEGTNTIYYCTNGVCQQTIVAQPPRYKGVFVPRADEGLFQPNP